MKYLRKLILAIILFHSASLMIVYSKEPFLPPPDVKANWEKLKNKGFDNWQELSFVGWGGAADGGSILFKFRTKDDISFEVLIASRNYWTEEDKAKNRQVIYIIESGLFYLLEPKSAEEQQLLKMILIVKSDIAKSDKIIKLLREKIESRKEIVDADLIEFQ